MRPYTFSCFFLDSCNLKGYNLNMIKSFDHNWRITFKFIEGNAFVVNYQDYH